MNNGYKLTIVLFITGLFQVGLLNAQNSTTIGGEELNNKAVLTLVTPTGDQGFILPIVENKENVNPSSSEKGMLVYENETSGVYLWDGANWINITTSSGSISTLNDLADVNAASPTEGQVLKFQSGVGWVPDDVSFEDTDDQNLLFADEILTIEDGEGLIDLSVYRQNISFNEETNELSITDGNSIIIPFSTEDADADPTNEIDVTTQSGVLVGDGSSVTGLAGTIGGQVLKWNNTNGSWELGSDDSGSSIWQENTDVIYTPSDNVGIGTGTPEGRLEVVSTDQQRALTLTQNYANGLNAFGSYTVMGGTGSGDKYGNFTQLQSGTGYKYGDRIVINHQADETSYAFNAETSNNGLGQAYGLRLAMLGSGTNYGIYSEGEDYNYLSGRLRVGVVPPETDKKVNVLAVEEEYAMNIYSNYSGSGIAYGSYASVFGSSSGEKYGSFMRVEEGTGAKYGAKVLVSQGADMNSYGFRTEMLNSGAGSSYGFYNEMLGSGTKYGIYSEGEDFNHLSGRTSVGAPAETDKRLSVYTSSDPYAVNIVQDYSGAPSYGIYVSGEDANYFSGRVNVGNTLTVTGEINRPSTGSANMVPLAYGYVTAGGTIGNGSGNWSVTRVSEGIYDIKITDETFAVSTHIAIVSKIGATGSIGWTSGSGNLRVTSVNSSDTVSDMDFSFVVYKP